MFGKVWMDKPGSGNEGENAALGPGTGGTVDHFTAAQDHERRDTGYVKGRGEGGLFVHVHLADQDVARADRRSRPPRGRPCGRDRTSWPRSPAAPAYRWPLPRLHSWQKLSLRLTSLIPPVFFLGPILTQGRGAVCDYVTYCARAGGFPRSAPRRARRRDARRGWTSPCCPRGRTAPSRAGASSGQRRA